MTIYKVYLKQVVTDQLVEAQLNDRIDKSYAEIAMSQWQPYIDEAKTKALQNGSPPPILEHENWLWREKVEASERILSMQTVGIDIAGEIQGLMMMRTDSKFCRIPSQLGKPLVYIDLLSSAPWNLREVNSQQKYRGMAYVMLGMAINTSLDLGFKGRIGLNSLPQAEPIYEKYNFEMLGIDKPSNLKYYEYTPELAAEFLR